MDIKKARFISFGRLERDREVTEEPEDSLLENMFFTSVIYDFLHQFLTDVESIMVNIGFQKPMLT